MLQLTNADIHEHKRPYLYVLLCTQLVAGVRQMLDIINDVYILTETRKSKKEALGDLFGKSFEVCFKSQKICK